MSFSALKGDVKHYSTHYWCVYYRLMILYTQLVLSKNYSSETDIKSEFVKQLNNECTIGSYGPASEKRRKHGQINCGMNSKFNRLLTVFTS